MFSAIYQGWVSHRRREPHRHGFRYRLFMLYLDLAELDRVFQGRWLWSTQRPALARFRREDHLGDARIPLDQAVRDLVQRETGIRPSGPIRLLTHLRYFGYGFNPVCFYYCFDVDDRHVTHIVAEINNTPWGEQHCYVLPHSACGATSGSMRFQFQKTFHVSPFMPMYLRYDWRFNVPGPRLNVHMALTHESKMFDATLSLERTPLSGSSLARVLTAFPFMTAKVITAIYWQALRLWLKGVPFYSHPNRHRSTTPGGADKAKRT